MLEKIKNYLKKQKENKQKKIDSDIMQAKLESAITLNIYDELMFLRKKIREEFEENYEIEKKEIDIYNSTCTKCEGTKIVDEFKTYGYGIRGVFGRLVDVKIGQEPYNKCGLCGHEWVRKYFMKKYFFDDEEIFKRAFFFITRISYFEDLMSLNDEDLNGENGEDFFTFFKDCKVETMHFFYNRGIDFLKFSSEEYKGKFNKQKLIQIGFKEFDLKEFEEKKETKFL